MSYALNVARTQQSNYNATWGIYAMGLVDKVTPDLKLETKPLKFGTTGGIVVGERIIALMGTVKVEGREIDPAMLAALSPWSSTGQPIPLIPSTWHKDLYDYAAALTLHPNHLALTDTTQDLVFSKAVPRMVNPGERDGVKDNVVVVEFSVFPDRAQLLATPPVLSYGTIGTAP